MVKKFIHFKTYNNFLSKLDTISDEQIVFIKDKQLIYTHGKYYGILPDNYKESALENIKLNPTPGDTFLTAISKLHKAILNNEEVIYESFSKLIESLGFTEKLEYNSTKTELNNKTVSLSIDYLVDTKVDKILGKDLSSNDYTNEAKTKVDNIPANPLYTDTTYTFTDGTDGSFNVTPKDGTAQKISIGKPATATTADKLGTDAGSATKPIYFSNGVPVAGTNELKKAANSESYLDVSADGISVTGIDALKTRIETLENRVGFETID